MITPDANFDAAKKNPASQPVLLAKLETSWKQARLSASGDFSSPISNTADITTKPGSIIAATSNGDILSATSYGTPTDDSFFETIIYGARLMVKSSIKLINFKFNCKTSSGSETVTVSLAKVDSENLAYNGTLLGSGVSYTEMYSTTISATTSYTQFTVTPTNNGNPIVLDPGVYLILLSHNDAINSIDCKLWAPNEDIWSNTSGVSYKGFHDDVFEIGRIGIHKDNGTYDTSTYAPLTGGYLFLEVLTVEKFITSSYDSGWKPVKNQAGSASAPSGNPFFYMEVSTRGINTVTGRARGADDGSGTNPSSQFTGLDDGDTIAATKAYYSLGVDITIGSNYADSPEVLALIAYEGTEEGFVKHENALFDYMPIVESDSSFESVIDPLKGIGSISEPQIVLAIHREGKDKTVSKAEQIIQNNYVNNSLLTVKYGFASVPEGSFIDLHKGLIDDYDYDANRITLKARDTLLRSKDPLGLDSISITSAFTINDVTPTNAILQLLKLAGTPLRLISDSDFTLLEGSGHWLDGWKVFRPYTETIEKVKEPINELCEIAGIAITVLEDGLLHAIILGPNGYNHSDTDLGVTGGKWAGQMLAEFNDDNSVEVGKCELNLSKRINNCRVHRGWWDEVSMKESKNKTSDEEWNEPSVLNYGIGPKKIIQSKWIPIATQVSSLYLSQIVAQKMVHNFGYGSWTLKRRTGREFIHLQIGDCVSVEGKQILFKGFGTTEKVRGQIIRKTLLQNHAIEWTIWIYENVNAIVSPTPSAQPTSLTFPAETTTTIDLSWTAASGSPSGYVVIRKAGSAPTYVPENGRIYKTLEEVATGEYIRYIVSTSFTDTGLTTGTTYHYAIYSYKAEAGIQSGNGAVFRPITYLKTSPLTGSHATD